MRFTSVSLFCDTVNDNNDDAMTQDLLQGPNDFVRRALANEIGMLC